MFLEVVVWYDVLEDSRSFKCKVRLDGFAGNNIDLETVVESNLHSIFNEKNLKYLKEYC
jgi:hypothetical protein